MDVNVRQNRQMRSMMIALGIAMLATVGAMFIPAVLLENVTGAAGLSELVPATAAPLGDTARALFAFSTGALTLAVLSVLLMRRDVASVSPAMVEPSLSNMAEGDDFSPSMMDRIANIRLPVIKLPRMPWVKDEDDITELADLPKLRNGDGHPDAPPRRPLLATQDLPVLGLPISNKVSAPADISAATEPAAPVAETILKPVASETAAVSVDTSLTLDEMVAQLEASVQQRQQQLAELEIVAANLTLAKHNDALDVTPDQHIETPPTLETFIQPVQTERPFLEVVPDSPATQDDMDEALTAALATLHRMNGTNR